MLPKASALVLREINGPLKMETVHFETLRPDELIVEIHATGICHTDLSCINGTLPTQTPIVLGHEGAGVVMEIGKDVADVKPGDKVVLSYNFCDSCIQCASKHPAYCENLPALNFGGCRLDSSLTLSSQEGGKLFGNFFGQSSFSTHSIVNKSCVVKVASDTPLEKCAPLGCGLQTGAGVVLNTLDVKSGSSLAIFGAGPVGLSSVMVGKIIGASQIIAIDIQPQRLVLAKELGATHVINGFDTDVVEQIRKICPPKGVDFAIDTTGLPKIIETMVDSLGIRGRAATIGSPAPGLRAGIEIFAHLINGREYVGCTQGDSIAREMVPYLIRQHAQGNYPFEKLITYYDAKDYAQAFDDMKSGKTIKPVLKWI